MGERAFLLHRLGVDRNTIAQVCGTNPEVISVRIAEAKRRGARRPTNARAATNTTPATDEAAATTEATV